MSMYVVGHKIPDSDSICGAIALAYLKTKSMSQQFQHALVKCHQKLNLS